MSKQLSFKDEARNRLLNGVNILADAVKVTIGAMGRNVVMERKGQLPHVTKDGYSVAKEIFLDDPVENMGAQMIKGVSKKTVEDTGDGTSTATILAQSMINMGMEALKVKSTNPIDLKRGIEKAVDVVVKGLDSMKKPVDTTEQIIQVATISANNDEEVGVLIGEAMSKVSSDGEITVEESKSVDTYVDVVEGIKLHRGYLSGGFITDDKAKTAVLENPFIFFTPNNIETIQDIWNIFEHIPSNRSLLVVGGGISGETINTLAINKVRNGMKVAAIKSPFLGESMKTALDDLAVVTGGVVLSEEKGLTFDRFMPEMFGTCSKVIISKDSTIIMGGKGDPEAVETLRASLRDQIASVDSKFEVEEIKARLSFISGAVAVVYVGGNSEIEIEEKKDRIDDALGATKAAVEEGIVAGGGVALMRAYDLLDGVEADNADQYTGIFIVRESLLEPIRQILNNAGLDSDVVIEGLFSVKGNVGFNVKTNEVGDMITMGVIDPKKVTRVALENAASVASQVLMVGCTIADN